MLARTLANNHCPAPDARHNHKLHPQVCAPGYYAGSGNTCPQCAPGSFCVGGAAGTAELCGVGLTSAAGATRRDQCTTLPGYGYINNAAAPCPLGSYSLGKLRIPCTK